MPCCRPSYVFYVLHIAYVISTHTRSSLLYSQPTYPESAKRIITFLFGTISCFFHGRDSSWKSAHHLPVVPSKSHSASEFNDTAFSLGKCLVPHRWGCRGTCWVPLNQLIYYKISLISSLISCRPAADCYSILPLAFLASNNTTLLRCGSFFTSAYTRPRHFVAKGRTN